MIAHAYYGCRQNFINRHPNVFPTEKAVEGEEEKPRKNQNPISLFLKS
jgi:hypothetical protein